MNKQSEPIESIAQARALAEKDIEIAKLRKELVELSEAAWRSHNYTYYPWANAGGLNECRHGIAAGFACERCDLLLIQLTYDKYFHITPPSTKPSTPPPTTS